jgi:hypothetical protein
MKRVFWVAFDMFETIYVNEIYASFKVNGKKQHKKPVFWLFWTISPYAMGLMI